MELIYADADLVDRGLVGRAAGDFSVGVENTWSLEMRDDVPVSQGCYVYVDGTEFGGIVDDVEGETGTGSQTCSGRTWHGILATNILCPASGKDYVEVEGEANACIAEVLDAAGVGAPFSAAEGPSGIEVSHRFERFCDVYSGLRSMLAASSARLSVAFSGGRVVLAAEKARSLTMDSDVARFSYARRRAYNHLVCLGSGELRNRKVLHLYADRQGRVSRTQSIFGAEHMAKVYDYNNADEDELLESGTEELEKLQTSDSADLADDPTGDLAVGDVVNGYCADRGYSVVESVTERIARVTAYGMTVECKTGETQASGSISASSESSGGTASYVAGDGIDISGGTISAEVDASDLEAVSQTAQQAATQASNALAAAGAAGQAANAAQQTADGKAPAEHTHTVSEIADFPDSMPASDVHEWAKATQKPAYTAQEVGAAPAQHTHSYAGASEPGGAAESAERLSEKRTVTISGAVSGSAEWDGSEDLSITVEGDTGSASFLAAHPVGSYFTTSADGDPGATYGGTWSRSPSMGAHVWHREA